MDSTQKAPHPFAIVAANQPIVERSVTTSTSSLLPDVASSPTAVASSETTELLPDPPKKKWGELAPPAAHHEPAHEFLASEPAPEPVIAANDAALEPAIKPIIIGAEPDAAVEKKRGWWRR